MSFFPEVFSPPSHLRHLSHLLEEFELELTSSPPPSKPSPPAVAKTPRLKSVSQHNNEFEVLRRDLASAEEENRANRKVISDLQKKNSRFRSEI